MPAAVARTAAPGFRPLRVAAVVRECADVISLSLEPSDGVRLTAPLAGQFVVLRLQPTPGAALVFRSYSLSGPSSGDRYRISVRIEPHGTAGSYLDGSVRPGALLDVSEPRGAFTLRAGDGPVVLLSAGIGATPVLAMLHALAAGASAREIWWLHSARNGKSHAFAAEVRQLVGALPHARSHVWYSRPDADDLQGRDHDATGRLAVSAFDGLRVPREGDFYLCGPPGFLGEVTAGLNAWGVPAGRIHSEVFSGGPSLMPGVVAGPVRAPHLPAVMPGMPGTPGTPGMSGMPEEPVRPARGPWCPSRAAASRFAGAPTLERSLLELAEACDVPVRWSCRTGVCHNCESGMISGAVAYAPEPLDAPARGNVLICCASPQTDVVIDL
jgi:ferredoxin-NADP reductase/ferredoxin